jgi:hypothetical protein
MFVDSLLSDDSAQSAEGTIPWGQIRCGGPAKLRWAHE